VASLLRIAGLSRERHFVNYHRILSRAAWSPDPALAFSSGFWSIPSFQTVRS
jgi:hypothetical protein